MRISANPLDDCTSFDAPLDAGDDGSGTRGDRHPKTRRLLRRSRNPRMKSIPRSYIPHWKKRWPRIVTVREAHILRRRYYDCQSLRAVGNELGVQRETIRQIERRCIRKLRELPKLQRWHDDIISTRAWRGTGLDAWSTTAAFKSALWNIWNSKQ